MCIGVARAVDLLLAGEDRVHEFVGFFPQGADFRLRLAEPGEIALFGKFFRFLDHPQPVGNPLEPADRRGHRLKLAAHGGEVFDAVEKSLARGGEIAVELEKRGKRAAEIFRDRGVVIVLWQAFEFRERGAP